MTALAAWIAYDQRAPSSAYIATDSRISWSTPDRRVVGYWDGVRKCFASAQFPDVFAYVGDVVFPSLVIGQFVDALDAGFFGSELTDAEARRVLLGQALGTAIKSYRGPASLAAFQIVQLARIGEGMESTFALHIFRWDGFRLTGATKTSLNRPAVLELGSDDIRAADAPLLDGSGTRDVEATLRDWQASPHAHTSRSVFSALCDAVRTGATPSVGGPVQLVGLYRVGSGRLLGVVDQNGPTVLGQSVGSTVLPGLEFRNEMFERVDASGSLLTGAKAHLRT